MLHELCELVNFNAFCIKNDTCSKCYLKSFVEAITSDSDEYSIYQ